MLFNSFAFLIFAPFFFVVYFALRGRARLIWSILASYFFYAWWDWRFIGLLIGSTIIAFYSGRMIGKGKSTHVKKFWLWFCVIYHLGILCFFKYLDFFTRSFMSVIHWFGFNITYKSLGILLPVGISFFTFTALSYTIDVYRGKKPEQDFLVYTTYRCLFPQLIAGPILRASDILPQIKKEQTFDWVRVGRGLEMIIWGYLLKLCLADNAALFAKPRFDNPQLFTSISLILAVVTFALQIYGDFAGYSLIAIGLAHIMGYDFPMNFNKPYFSVSLSEFWSRWHITLGKWFRDYVFLPTAYALSRRLKDERYFGLKTEHWIYTISTLLTMVLVGLWHGSSWNFIFWGFLHGTYLSIQRWGTKPARRIRRKIHCPKFVSNPIAAIFVFSLVCISWIFFRSISMANAIYTLKSIFSWQTTAHLSFGGMKFQLLRIGFVACIVMIVDLLGSRKSSSAWIETHVYLRVISAAFAVLVILFTGNFASNSFIYFQF